MRLKPEWAAKAAAEWVAGKRAEYLCAETRAKDAYVRTIHAWNKCDVAEEAIKRLARQGTNTYGAERIENSERAEEAAAWLAAVKRIAEAETELEEALSAAAAEAKAALNRALEAERATRYRA